MDETCVKIGLWKYLCGIAVMRMTRKGQMKCVKWTGASAARQFYSPAS
ncbi:hypothetical protein SAMN05446635_0198 [Burkholderia sp. OK233]|nr:hypothetical protein SAMN05446635_0198 [Burkholderia sp. OK233]